MLQIRVGNPVWEAPQIAVRCRPPERQLLTALRSHLCYIPNLYVQSESGTSRIRGLGKRGLCACDSACWLC